MVWKLLEIKIKFYAYPSLVGSVMYAMFCSKPDLTCHVSLVYRVMSNPKKPHWHAIKNIFQYFARTKNLGLKFGKNVKIGKKNKKFCRF